MARFTAIDTEAFEKARAAGKRLSASKDPATSACYDAVDRKVFVHFASGRALVFDPARLQALRNASVAELEDVSIEGYGDTLSFRRIDADFAISRLVEMFGYAHAIAGRL